MMEASASHSVFGQHTIQRQRLAQRNFALASELASAPRTRMICQLGESHGLLQIRFPNSAVLGSKQGCSVRHGQMIRPSANIIRPRCSCEGGVGGEFSEGVRRITIRKAVAREDGSGADEGRGETVLSRVLIGMVASSFLLLDLSNASAADDDKQIPGLDSLPAKPGLVERLVEKSKANKAKYDQERLDNYYKRNYKDYFEFLKGRLVNRDPETLTEAEKGILNWLEKNS